LSHFQSAVLAADWGDQPVPPVQPHVLELAFYLRRLRLERWPGTRLTQAALAKALGGDIPLAPATVASWENKITPKLPPADRMLVYAQFFATRRSLESREPALVPVDTFTDDERAEHDRLRGELLRLHAAAQPAAEELEATPRSSWHFGDNGTATLICPQLPEQEWPAMAHPDNPNYTELLQYADIDAMVELFAYLHEVNSSPVVHYRSSPQAVADDLSGHVVLIGGVGWNNVTARLLDLAPMPVEQRADPAVKDGEIFVVKDADGDRKYLPIWSSATPPEPIEDVGLLVRMPNPFNSTYTLTVCNGVHSRGVYGAVRSLTDRHLRKSNERYIAEHFPDGQFGILMRVLIIQGKTMTPDFSSAGTVLHQWSGRA
jgi:hypothetical protein